MLEPWDEIRASEIGAIEGRYDRRRRLPVATPYDPFDPYVCRARQVRERALIHCIRLACLEPVGDKRVLEIGCGSGANLIELIRLGFQPGNLVGNDLLEKSLNLARVRLPQAVTTILGDAATLDLEEDSFDIVLQSTVFSSILNDTFQERLAERMWALARPCGGILWYDFTWNNPANPDVRGVPLKRVRQLFPGGSFRSWRVTLAPPIGRRLCRISPALYTTASAISLLRTHILCWIQKPRVRSTPYGGGSAVPRC